MILRQWIHRSRVAVLGAALVVAPPLSGQSPAPGQKRPPLVIQSMDGRDLYDFYCASCHGKTGRGDGADAKNLKVVPPDLTALSSSNRGQFPADRVRAVLTGEVATASHGSKTMPVWGDVFKFLDPNDQRAKVRVSNLTAYLESLQMK